MWELTAVGANFSDHTRNPGNPLVIVDPPDREIFALSGVEYAFVLTNFVTPWVDIWISQSK